jgi:hypothetical protein
MSDAPTKKDDESDLEMRSEYDFSGGVRGKYASRFAKGSKVIVLDPDVAAAFDSSEAVNTALRERLAERQRKVAGDGGV